MKYVGIGTRVLNFVVDTLLVFILGFAAFKGWEFYAYYWGIPYFPFYYFFWLTLFIYYLFFESIFKRTPAKWLTYSKVIKKNGGRPSFMQILIRSIVRVATIVFFDCVFIPFIDKTLHDYLSGTDIIEV